MKLDTKIVVSQGAAFVMIGFFTPCAAGLAQWLNSGELPSVIGYLVLFSAGMVGAATQWVGFCSGVWKDYARQMKADDTGVEQTVTAVPTAGVDTTAEKARKAQAVLDAEKI